MVAFRSLRRTVNPIDARPLCPTLCPTMSTATFLPAMAAKIWWLTPGRSGTFSRKTRTSSLARAAPATGKRVIHSASGTIQVPSASAKLLRTMSGTSYFLANSMTGSA